MSNHMSEREIAKAMGVARGSVRMYLKRGMEKLRASRELKAARDAADDAAHAAAVVESSLAVSRRPRDSDPE